MRRLLFIIQVLALLELTSCGRTTDKRQSEHKELTVNERYPLPWTEPTNDQLISIGQALVGSDIGDCGEYYIRPSSQDKGEFLVGCTANGTTWTYYIVWPDISKVDGPHTDTTIDNPR